MPSTNSLQLIPHNEGKLFEVKMSFNSKNTYDLEGLETIVSTLGKLAENDKLRALVLSSSVDGYFSNGLEPKMFLGASKKEVQEAVVLLMRASQAFYLFPFPTISLIQGHCMAAGAVFAIFSDYRFMVDRGARIGFSEALVGLNFPSFPAKILTELVGFRESRDLLYTGRLIKGDEALKIGLVDYIYPKAELEAECFAFAHKISQLPLGSAKGIKKAMIDPYRIGMKEITQWDTEALVETIMTSNAQEGFQSILEARKPNFNN
jgi:enoyl-CoA hydratase/carnithine racemase